MIAFLTLCYVAVLALLVKLKVVKLNLWWKLSPLAWMILLLIVLFIPMQWGAPAGPVTQTQYVVEIIPNVSGEVVEVPAKPLVPMKKGDVLFKLDVRPFEYQVANLEAGLRLAKLNLSRAQELYQKNLGREVDVDRYTSEVEQLTAQLDSARYELDETVIRAPGNGYVIGLTLRPGQRVANLPLRSWMAYVRLDQARLVAGISQARLRHVKPGQPAEVTLRLYPGKTINARVESIAYMTPEGQFQPSGLIPQAPTGQQPPAPYGVILQFDQEEMKKLGLEAQDIAGGAAGTAAIYTDTAKITHIIRRVMVRMEAWLNYIKP